MSITFVCPLCGHQVTAEEEQVGQRVTCDMCTFKVEVPKPVPVVVVARPAPPPPPPPPAPPAEQSETSLEEVPSPGRPRKRTQVGIMVTIAVVLAVALVSYGAMHGPEIYHRLSGAPQEPRNVPAPQVEPGRPLSPADNVNSL